MISGPQRRRVAWLALVVVFLVGMRGLVYRVRLQFGDASGSLLDDVPTQVVFHATYVLALMVGVSLGRPRLDRRVVVPLGALCAVLIASTLWSIESGRTLNQSLLMAVGTLAVVILVSGLRAHEVAAALVAATGIGVVLSIVAVAAGWDYSTDHRGRMTGIFYNRNALGLVASVLVVVAAGWWWCNRVDRRVRIAGPILVVTGLVVWWRSGSATAMIAAATGLAVGLWVIAFQRGDSNRRTALRWIALVSAVVTVLAVSTRDQLAQWIGRDATFTGRTSTWDIVIDAWRQRPLFGFGFFAGWFDSDVRAGLREIGYNHWEAHNGYLEVLLGAGVIGAVALVWFIVAAVRALRSSIHERWAPWFVSLVAMSLVVNIGETGIGANRLAWFVLVAGVVSARAVDR